MDEFEKSIKAIVNEAEKSHLITDKKYKESMFVRVKGCVCVKKSVQLLVATSLSAASVAPRVLLSP
jgi:hypothetical protein